MSEQEALNEEITRRWFTDGWRGQLAFADEIFSDTFSTNGEPVGPEGPKRNIRNRLTGFPDLRTEIEQGVASGETVVIRVRWRGTHTGVYSGLPATGKPVVVRVISIWRFETGKVEENWTVQDQFSLLKQVGYIPAEIGGAQVAA